MLCADNCVIYIFIFIVIGSFVPDLADVIGQNNILLIANKFDLLPREARKHEARIVGWYVMMIDDIVYAAPYSYDTWNSEM